MGISATKCLCLARCRNEKIKRIELFDSSEKKFHPLEFSIVHTMRLQCARPYRNYAHTAFILIFFWHRRDTKFGIYCFIQSSFQRLLHSFLSSTVLRRIIFHTVHGWIFGFDCMCRTFEEKGEWWNTENEKDKEWENDLLQNRSFSLVANEYMKTSPSHRILAQF